MIFLMKRIYLDYAALTPIDNGVMKIMKKYSNGDYTNPSSLYASGVAAKNAVDQARKEIAASLHAHPDEIYFTNGGTHGNDLILKDQKKVVISNIEHSSIIDLPNVLKIPVDIEILKKSLSPEISVVSVMLVNNETGSIQPISDIVKIVRDFNKNNGTKILVHTDACQAGLLPLFVEKLGVDLMTLDGNKMYGPRSTGIIYVKRGSMKMEERGTLNVPGILGFAECVRIREKFAEKEYVTILGHKTFFLNELLKINPEIKVNGSLENSTPHILNVSIPNIDSEFFILQLDAGGIECSTKSACLRDEDESYVLKAIGADSKTSVRFSFGRETSKGDIRRTLKIIEKILFF